MKKTYVQDPETGKFVEKSTVQSQQHAIHVMQPFTSPIDGTRIRDSAQLRTHNRHHGVTDSRDYSPDWFAKHGKAKDDRLTGNTRADKAHRIESLKRAIDNN